MEERYIATADLGTSKIAVCVACVQEKNIQIVYYRETPSDGIRQNTVFNPTKASEPMKRAIRQAEEELGIKITQIVLGLPRYPVHQEARTAEFERTEPESCITDEEITNLKDIALTEYPLDESGTDIVYGAVTQSFSADYMHNASQDDIVGIPADKLEGNFKVFVGKSRFATNLDILMRNVGIPAAMRLFVPDATAKAVLSHQEMDNGVALIEIGAGVTSVIIYQNSIMRHYRAIPFGAGNITRDIKSECGFSEALSENIKLAFGACMPEKLLTMSEKIIQVENEESGSVEQLPVKYLSEIITCRAKEILTAILFEIQQSGYADKLRSGVVITGGGACTLNIDALLKDMSGYNVRIGFPNVKKYSIQGIDGISSPAAATTVGMLIESLASRNLNCTDEIVPEEDVQEETESVDSTAGTVFEKIEGAKKKKARRNKDNPEKEQGKNKPKVTWTNNLIEKVGNLFDSMN